MESRYTEPLTIDQHDPDAASLKRGLGWLEAEAERRPGATAWIATASKAAVRRGVVAAVLGASVARALAAGRAVPYSRRRELKLVTDRNLPARGLDGPVLAIYPTRRLLDRLGRLPGVAALAVVP
jgi:hypothetical protein